MVNIYPMALGAYQTNCYIVWGGESPTCVVIDPGYAPEKVLAQVRSLGKEVEAVLLTHGHFDHVGGVKNIAMDMDCRVYLCPEDLTMPHPMTAGPLYYTHTYGEGDVLKLAGLSFRVLHTPGHTQGSVCLQCEKELFSGDTLFQCSCGRTDLPGGDWAVIQRSLKRLAAIGEDLTVYPGHGGFTTLDYEKKFNPYM